MLRDFAAPARPWNCKTLRSIATILQRCCKEMDSELLRKAEEAAGDGEG